MHSAPSVFNALARQLLGYIATHHLLGKTNLMDQLKMKNPMTQTPTQVRMNIRDRAHALDLAWIGMHTLTAFLHG